MDQDLYHILQQLQQQIIELQHENQSLKEALSNIKPVNIENINYKIQELHVKELKGTLNIGLTGEAHLDDMETIIDEIQQDGIQQQHQTQDEPE
ncbi:Spore germination protein GerPC [Fictibacillus solisalsi]|uniref:Spore germination protein GerPC n=1 Tax=Fictibacillus solisalsi TaxID=459525 RepID=A0A1H0CZF1_9BACL|nr:spore germination protein GerPC [Fictibacillus solisalsi]SDN63295.1 Spore germination protein GerPC [Fictibacillus solisalsi]